MRSKPRRKRVFAKLIAIVAGALALGAAGLAALSVEAAAGARPVAGAHYLGFYGDETQVNDIPGVSGELRVARDRRHFSSSRRGSYVRLTITCPRDTSEFVTTRVRLASAHRRVRIGRGGRFRLAARRGRLSYRLRGRFVVPGEARIAWRARTAPRHPKHRRHPGLCKDSGLVTLYRNGHPPFGGCHSQRAKTLLEGSTGRVFEQYDISGGNTFFPHLYACLFGNKRYHLGVNWDDMRLDVFRLAGPFVGYSEIGCAIVGCFSAIRVRDLRDGKTFHYGTALCDKPPDSSTAQTNQVPDLELKDNGSVAWTIAVNRSPYVPGYLEVCAADTTGRRQLDVGNGIDLNSLTLSGSTLTWVKDGVARSATLQ